VSEQYRATARACGNVALIKYWGRRDAARNLPLNDSISMTLSGAVTLTTVVWDEELRADEVYLDGERLLDARATAVSRHLDLVRQHYYRSFAQVASLNSVPPGTGLASSASGYAALTTAAIAAFGEGLPAPEALSRLARHGSGSASRSIHGGFVRWRRGEEDDDSVAGPLFPPDWWDLRDVCVVLSTRPKEISSRQGHRLASSHPFMPARQALLPNRTAAVAGALASRDLTALGELAEAESLEVQALMLSSTPSCLYLEPATVQFMHAVRRWREEGLEVYLTLDAGPNPHLLCRGGSEQEVLRRAAGLAPDADLILNRPGPGVTLVEDHLL